MPQPVSNTTTIVSGSLLANKISYVVDGQGRDYRGGYGGLEWMSEAPASNNVIFIGNTTTIGRGPADKPLFYPSFNNTEANIVYAVNTLPGSPGNFTTSASAYDWAATNNFFINNSDNPIPRIDADGLQAYLDSSQPTSYPQTGTSWYDLSGFSGTAGSLINGPTWNQNGYFELDNTNDQIRITGPDYNALAASGNFTIILTGKKTEYGTSGNNSGNSTLFQGVDNGYNGGWRIIETNTGTPGTPFTSPHSILMSLPQLVSSRIVSDTVYRPFFYAFSFTNGNTGLAFLNGYLSQGSNTYGGGSTNEGYISYGGAGVGLWGGWIKSVQVYNKGLSLEEIKQNYFQSNIVTDGLVFMADASNLVSYPKSGTTTYSLTGSLSGTLLNGIGYSTGNGGAWVFDGVNDRIDVSAFNVSYLTIDTWVYRTSTTTNQGISRKQNEWALSQYNGTLQIAVGPAWYFLNTGYTIPLNTWTHIAYTYNGTNQIGSQTVYINGEEIFSATDGSGPISAGGSTYRIGYDDNGWFWGGKIANQKIYNKALTAGEVQQNYEATKDKFLGSNIITNGLVMNLDAADKDSYSGTGTSWDDLSGNENNGTLTNGPIFLPNENGGVFKFDGTNDAAIVPSSALTSPSSLTIETVFKRTGNLAQGVGCPLHRNDGTNGNVGNSEFTIAVYKDNSNYIYGSIGANTGVVWTNGFTGVICDLNTYYHVITTWDGTDVRTYVNGDLKVTYGLPSYGNSGGNIRIGTSADNGGTYQWNGTIGFSRIYKNRALSASEVLQNYNTIRTRFGF